LATPQLLPGRDYDWRAGLRGRRAWGRAAHPWPPAIRALVAAVFMRAIRDALGVDWRPVAPEDRESAREFLRSPWAANLAWALGLDAAALVAWVERAQADSRVRESARVLVQQFCARAAGG
ncbi:MAG: hypothetical protein AB1816_17730, partial [Bacillota bacterium]